MREEMAFEEEEEEQEDDVISEEKFQQLRSNATQLLLAENWDEYISLYSRFISHLSCSSHSTSAKLQKCLCLALSNRAEAFHRLGHLQKALDDCDQVLAIDSSYRKTLLCKGKILLDLDCYSSASVCFQKALDSGLLDRCRRLEAQSRNGSLDISDWVLAGFGGDPPDIAEYVGPVEIRKSKNGGGRGLFATKNVGAGTLLFITKAIVIGRGILPKDSGNGSGDEGRLVMWKDFVDRILMAATKSRRALQLIYSLSTGEEEEDDEKDEIAGVRKIPDMGMFKPEEQKWDDNSKSTLERPDTNRILKILDLNCLTGDSISARVLGRNTSDYCTVGLWILPSFLNHSCHPNARRLHIGDRVVVHASRDVKAGEELTFAYFDVFQPLQERREKAKGWGFHCRCERCEFEEKVWAEVRGVESAVEVEEWMGKKGKRWVLKGKEKGYLRASFWKEYAWVYGSERLRRRCGRRIPVEVVAAESVAGVVGGDERVLKVVVDGMKKGGNGGEEVVEKVMKLGRGVYGKVVRKRQAIRALLEELPLQLVNGTSC